MGVYLAQLPARAAASVGRCALAELIPKRGDSFPMPLAGRGGVRGVRKRTFPRLRQITTCAGKVRFRPSARPATFPPTAQEETDQRQAVLLSFQPFGRPRARRNVPRCPCRTFFPTTSRTSRAYRSEAAARTEANSALRSTGTTTGNRREAEAEEVAAPAVPVGSAAILKATGTGP